MLLDFYISLAMEGHLIYINCPMYLPGKAGYLRYLLLLNHPNKLFIQNLVVYRYFVVLDIPRAKPGTSGSMFIIDCASHSPLNLKYVPTPLQMASSSK